MSQENVDLSLRLNDAWARRDAEAVVALRHPEAVWCPSIEGSVDGRMYRGDAAIRQYYRDSAGITDQHRMESPDVRNLGDRAGLRE